MPHARPLPDALPVLFQENVLHFPAVHQASDTKNPVRIPVHRYMVHTLHNRFRYTSSSFQKLHYKKHIRRNWDR